MLSLKECRKIDPSLSARTDAEILEIRDQLYAVAEMAYEEWRKIKQSSKIPRGVSEEYGE